MAPVVILALAPTLDKSLKEHRSLCPVRALRCYLNKTQDLRQGKDLIFVSFEKGFIEDILPGDFHRREISTWLTPLFSLWRIQPLEELGHPASGL